MNERRKNAGDKRIATTVNKIDKREKTKNIFKNK